uniref:Immunoglobulin V-set domain-containing protein n=1 Tax=Astyanax mexicanus TaxID=7994 RepID=A0A3B1KEF6_ASTMX
MMLTSVFAWFIISSTTAYGDVMFLRRGTNASVEISCEFPNITKDGSLMAFALKCHQNQSKEVQYLNLNSTPKITNKNTRFSVKKLPKSRKVNVIITNLQEDDTDIYWCVFYYNKGLEVQIQINGSTEFFLYVEAPEQCSCSNLLLYVLTAVALLLFFCVLILTRAYYRKPTVQPVYEDMRAVRSLKRPKD